MFMTIILVIFLIATAVAIGGFVAASRKLKATTDSYDSRDARAVRFGWGIASAVCLVLLLAVGFFATVRIVSATEVGIPVAFGTVGAPIQSGLNIVAPWIDVETYPTRPVTVELAGDQKILARTADAGQMSVEVAARWKVDPSKAKDLYMQVRTGDDQYISDQIVTKNLRQAVGQVYSATGNLDALNGREGTAQAIKEQLQAQLTAYGITIEDINLRSVEPDAKTASTIASYASQQQATRIAEEAKKTAEIEAQRRLIEANGLQAASKALAGISPEQAQMLCIQVWQQTVTKGMDAGVPVYTSPCGSGAVVPVTVTDKPAAAQP